MKITQHLPHAQGIHPSQITRASLAKTAGDSVFAPTDGDSPGHLGPSAARMVGHMDPRGEGWRERGRGPKAFLFEAVVVVLPKGRHEAWKKPLDMRGN